MSPDIIDWMMCQRKYQPKRQESNIYTLFSDQNKTINMNISMISIGFTCYFDIWIRFKTGMKFNMIIYF